MAPHFGFLCNDGEFEDGGLGEVEAPPPSKCSEFWGDAVSLVRVYLVLVSSWFGICESFQVLGEK